MMDVLLLAVLQWVCMSSACVDLIEIPFRGQSRAYLPEW